MICLWEYSRISAMNWAEKSPALNNSFLVLLCTYLNLLIDWDAVDTSSRETNFLASWLLLKFDVLINSQLLRQIVVLISIQVYANVWNFIHAKTNLINGLWKQQINLWSIEIDILHLHCSCIYYNCMSVFVKRQIFSRLVLYKWFIKVRCMCQFSCFAHVASSWLRLKFICSFIS